MGGNSATPSDVDAYISQADPSQREVLEAIRQIVLRATPGIAEAIKWGQPCYSRSGNICYIADDLGHVKFGFFRGGDLADPESLLEGTGKRMRHIKVRGLEDIREEAFTSLVKQAVELDESEGI